jgi:hypothetical protein
MLAKVTPAHRHIRNRDARHCMCVCTVQPVDGYMSVEAWRLHAAGWQLIHTLQRTLDGFSARRARCLIWQPNPHGGTCCLHCDLSHAYAFSARRVRTFYGVILSKVHAWRVETCAANDVACPGCSGGMGGGSGAFALQQPCVGRGGNGPHRVSSSGGLDSSLSSPRPGSPASAELFGAGCLLLYESFVCPVHSSSARLVIAGHDTSTLWHFCWQALQQQLCSSHRQCSTADAWPPW